MLLGEFVSGGQKLLEKREETYGAPVSSVFASRRNWNDRGKGFFGMNRLIWQAEKKVFRASFTIEATLVLGVVFMTVAMLIRYAYIEHDKITGTMILAETVQKARTYSGKELSPAYFEEQGELRGNPRLWLGEYQLEINSDWRKKINGEAAAGEWRQEIEMDMFLPGDFLRQTEALKALIENGEEQDDRGDRIQERDESELYGNTFGATME